MAFYQGWLSLNLIRWVFNAEKPDAFPQEKTDTSYPRASLGSCPWQLLLTRPQQSWSAASMVSFPYPASKTAHKAAQGRVWFLPRTNLPLPLKGEELGIVFLGLVGFALLVQNSGTPAQQGRSGASLVSFPYLARKIAHRALQGRVWFHRRFLVRFFCSSPANWHSRW